MTNPALAAECQAHAERYADDFLTIVLGGAENSSRTGLNWMRFGRSE